ncbi:MAG: hypothetical protein Q9Q13_08990 [Acidobacteriota bacterium]|nr:hypothetical protein [Acidobacteriota bacterium]
MIRSTRLAPLALIALLLAAFALPTLAEPTFDLRIDLALDDSTASALRPGDVVRVELLAAEQFGVEPVEQPLREERTVGRDDLQAEWRFARALVPGQIYRMEMTIIRNGVEVRYLSALSRLARHAADHPGAMRLVRTRRQDRRHTLVMLHRDADGVVRLSVFTA